MDADVYRVYHCKIATVQHGPSPSESNSSPAHAHYRVIRLIWTTIVARRLCPQNPSSTPMASPGIRERVRIELVVIRERLGTKTIDFKEKGRLVQKPPRTALVQLGIGTKSTLTQSANPKHFLIANYHTTDFCTYEIRVYKVRISYIT